MMGTSKESMIFLFWLSLSALFMSCWPTTTCVANASVLPLLPSFASKTRQRRLIALSQNSESHDIIGNEDCTINDRHTVDDDDDDNYISSSTDKNTQRHTQRHYDNDHDSGVMSTRFISRVKAWPPWPLNLILTGDDSDEQEQSKDTPSASSSTPSTSAKAGKIEYRSTAEKFWVYARQKTKITLRQVQEISSQLFFHLPPITPPLVVIGCIPLRMTVIEPKNAGVTVKRIMLPLTSNPYIRNIVLSGLGLAIVSWAHMEVHRKRQLTPLPLYTGGKGVSRAILPPYLPEDVPEPELQALHAVVQEQKKEESPTTTPNGIQQQRRQDEIDTSDSQPGQLDNPNNQESSSDESSISSDQSNDDYSSSSFPWSSPKFSKYLNQSYSDVVAQIPKRTIFQSTIKEWGRKRDARKREVARANRRTIFEELVALQTLKRRRANQQKQKTSTIKKILPGSKSGSDNNDSPPIGCALVTGASHGIGRAIAVELARWEVPLILVARNLDALTSLAYDLEACYGVECYVLQADLSKPNAAEQIFETTQKQNIRVDILINNVGMGTQGSMVDMSINDVHEMVSLNMMPCAKLSNLYGNQMRKQRRGRILMVGSMAGNVSASPGAGLYGATKAFTRSLSFSMAKEMEPYGVGVTCVMPGPVHDTTFRSSSSSNESLCWKIPFYQRSAKFVAHQAVNSLLDGDTQCIPGWQNRFFAKVVCPVIPQRFQVMAVQAAWSPFYFPFQRKKAKQAQTIMRRQDGDFNDSDEWTKQPSRWEPMPDVRPRYASQTPPKLLVLPKPPEPKPIPQPVPTPVPESNNYTNNNNNDLPANTKNTTATTNVPQNNDQIQNPGSHTEISKPKDSTNKEYRQDYGNNNNPTTTNQYQSSNAQYEEIPQRQNSVSSQPADPQERHYEQQHQQQQPPVQNSNSNPPDRQSYVAPNNKQNSSPPPQKGPLRLGSGNGRMDDPLSMSIYGYDRDAF